MKTLIATILVAFLTVTVVSPAKADLSSGDQDKLIGAGVIAGLLWLFGDSERSHSSGSDIIQIEERCRPGGWGFDRCRDRNRAANQWAMHVERYLVHLGDFYDAQETLFQASAKLAELEVYAQKDKSVTMRKQLTNAEIDLRNAKKLVERFQKRMKDMNRPMQSILIDYQNAGGNPDKLKEYAFQQQEMMENYDPSVAPWEQ